MAKATQTTVIAKWTLELSDEEAKCLRGMLGGATSQELDNMSQGCSPQYSNYVNRTYALSIKNALDAAGI